MRFRYIQEHEATQGSQDTMAHNSLSVYPCARSCTSIAMATSASGRYLDTSTPEMQLVADGNKQQQQQMFVNKGLRRPKVLQSGRLCNLATGQCLMAQGRASQKGGSVVLRPCDLRDPAGSEEESSYSLF